MTAYWDLGWRQSLSEGIPSRRLGTRDYEGFAGVQLLTRLKRIFPPLPDIIPQVLGVECDEKYADIYYFAVSARI